MGNPAYLFEGSGLFDVELFVYLRHNDFATWERGKYNLKFCAGYAANS
jgi:hypothetical protein